MAHRINSDPFFIVSAFLDLEAAARLLGLGSPINTSLGFSGPVNTGLGFSSSVNTSLGLSSPVNTSLVFLVL